MTDKYVLKTILDKNTFPSRSLTCDEVLSEYCHLTITLETEEEITETNIGSSISTEFKREEEKEPCHFWGLCKEIESYSYNETAKSHTYHIKAVDPLSLLAFRSNRQIFQNMTTKDILEKIFNAAEIATFIKFTITGAGKTHIYCVQFDETDQAFALRLLADEGWHFHVNHKKKLLVIGDSNEGFPKVKESFQFKIHPNRQFVASAKIDNWQQSLSMVTGSVSCSARALDLGENIEGDTTVSKSTQSLKNMGQYNYGLIFEDTSKATELATFYMQAMDAQKSTSTASSGISLFYSGLKFTLEEHPLTPVNQEYLITKISHSITISQSVPSYSNTFTCIPSTAIFRIFPQKRPQVHSVHSATVTGPSGKEIYIDELGRIKVQFHWDKEGKGDENTSCWLPVSQSFASKGFGSQFTPRIGDDVLVQYIDGNPDNPVIVGSFYTKKNEPPYKEETLSGIKTRTTPDGDAQKGHELRFDDKKDNEQVYLHSEKDLLIEVNNDSTEVIIGTKSVQIEKNAEMTAKENIAFTTDKEFTSNSKENWDAKSDKNINLNAESDVAIAAKMACNIDGNEIKITGKQSITLCVGASKIEITASGIIINAPTIKIEATASTELKSGTINIESSIKANIKSLMVNVSGSVKTEVTAGAVTQFSGGVVMINS